MKRAEMARYLVEKLMEATERLGLALRNNDQLIGRIAELETQVSDLGTKPCVTSDHQFLQGLFEDAKQAAEGDRWWKVRIEDGWEFRIRYTDSDADGYTQVLVTAVRP